MNLKDLVGKNLGRYHVIEPLGQGGMASVFKAYDTTLERHVAIKVIRPDLDNDNEGEFLKRFQREARALAQLDHPYILKVLDYGEQDGLPYLVMPFVPGGTLKEKMGIPLSSTQAAALLAPIARALDYAHHQQIIHRDVKPANILISQSGAPLLSDFGIAKMLSSENSAQLTATGVGIGTPDYMAPEQWMGVADPITDVYSLGVVFYEMVTGHRPFTADTPAAVLVKHLRDPLPRPRSYVADLPEDVEQVLYKALAKEPKNRFQDMGDFAAALERLARGERTQLAGLPVDIPTLQTGDMTAFAAGTMQATTRQPIPTSQYTPPAPQNQNWKLGLTLLVVAVLAGVVCIVIGGTLLAARSYYNNTAQSTSLPGATLAPGTIQPPQIAATNAEPANTQPPAQTETHTPAPPTLKIDGLPDDVPLFTDNNGDLTSTLSQGMHMYTLSSKAPFDQIKEFYLTGMKKNGWQVINETTHGETITWGFMKDDKRVVMITLSSFDMGTMISLMLPPIQ